MADLSSGYPFLEVELKTETAGDPTSQLGYTNENCLKQLPPSSRATFAETVMLKVLLLLGAAAFVVLGQSCLRTYGIAHSLHKSYRRLHIAGSLA